MSKLEQFILNFPWVRHETTPFCKLEKDLNACTVALVSTGGLYATGDTPFEIVTREDVDESYRSISSSTAIGDLRIAHEHFNKAHSTQDLNVIFPLERLQALVEEGLIGSVAQTNYSITGYIPEPKELFNTGKAMAQAMLAEGVDAVIMVPV